jgi:hypothetical protein
MKKLLVTLIVLGLLFSIGSSVYAANVGLGYGFFESEGGFDVDGLILSSDSNFGENYNFTSRHFMGEGDGNYENNLLDLENNLLDLNIYKKMNKEGDTDFYLGAGWKWLIEDYYIAGVDLSNSAWGLPISAKINHKLNEKLSFGGKVDYWFLGSYDIDAVNTNTGASANLSDDFSGFGIDLYLESQLANNFSIKLGYANEDHTYDNNSSSLESGFDSSLESGFDGFYFSGLYNY